MDLIYHFNSHLNLVKVFKLFWILPKIPVVEIDFVEFLFNIL